QTGRGDCPPAPAGELRCEPALPILQKGDDDPLRPLPKLRQVPAARRAWPVAQDMPQVRKADRRGSANDARGTDSALVDANSAFTSALHPANSAGSVMVSFEGRGVSPGPVPAPPPLIWLN